MKSMVTSVGTENSYNFLSKKIGVISLGCDKNRVDTEKMLGLLKSRHTIVPDPLDAEIIIINTCAFLNSSRKEALEEILSAATLKDGKLEKLIVTGCLPQKFIDELFTPLKEVDAFLGTDDYAKILDIIDGLYKESARQNAVNLGLDGFLTDRVLTTDNYAYLKISDGCSNRCTYCLIPSIRGPYRSYKEEDLINETVKLGKVKELILVAQDLTKYGIDLYGKLSLPRLIKKLSALDNVSKIRLLYCYPENVNDELIEEIKNNPKVIKYIDIPFQHADDYVLKRMNRKGTYLSNLALVEKLKNSIPEIAIRSTFITGFPGESEIAHEKLKEFLLQAKLFNAGFFEYSREEGTPAYNFKDQISAKIKHQRIKELYAVQETVVKDLLEYFVNKTLNVSVENFDGVNYVGRAYFNAPDIDGKVVFKSNDKINIGDDALVQITDVKDYDLIGFAK